MKSLLLSTAVLFIAAFSVKFGKVQAYPFDPQGIQTSIDQQNAFPFDPKNIQAFVEQQFADYFTNCKAFVESFKANLKYCDGVSKCITNKKKLLELCLDTEGSVNVIHTALDIKPGTTPFPNYAEIAISGEQTVCLALPEIGMTPLCFLFTITEQLIEDGGGVYDLLSTEWKGYYNVIPGTCPGYEPLVCSAP